MKRTFWPRGWWGVGVLWLASASQAAPPAEVAPGAGAVAYGLQVAGLGEYDRLSHHLDVTFGVTEVSGVGLSLSRLFGTDDVTGDRLARTIGDLHVKYQFLERNEVVPGPTFSALAGYQFVHKTGETLSGFKLGALGDLPLTPRSGLQGRLGLGFFEGGTLVDFDLSVSFRVRPQLEAQVGLRTFSVGGETEGGVVLGVVHHFSSPSRPAPEQPW